MTVSMKQNSISSPRPLRAGVALVLALAASAFAGSAWAQAPAQAPLVNTPPNASPLDPLTGGLLPPPAPDTPEAQQTIQTLEQSERRDSGRGLSFVWFSLDPSFVYSGLDLFSGDTLVDGTLVKASGYGPGVGATLGLRLLYLSLSVQGKYLKGTAFDAWDAGLLASLRIPLGRLEPYASIGGGYLRAFNFDGEKQVYALGTKVADLSVGGGHITLQGGLDYYITPVFSVGLAVTPSLLLLKRDRVLSSGNSVYARSASAVGFSVTTALVLGLHF